MTAVFDTNILVDALNGIPEAGETFDRYPSGYISRIVWIEVLAGARDAAAEAEAHALLAEFFIEEVTASISERAVRVRRGGKLKLPDALIYATAIELNAKLVTRNTKDFPLDDPVIHLPYQLPPPRPD